LLYVNDFHHPIVIPLIIKAPLVFFSTLIGTLFILPKLIHIASTWIVVKQGTENESLSLMDYPDNHRKVHESPKPLVGGIGMLMIVSFSSVLFVPPSDINLRGYYSAVILLSIAGFLDDFKELHYKWKFIAQLVAVMLMMQYSRSVLISFGNILSFGSIDFGIFFAPVTVFCTIGVINAINMIDGLDGLAGGISLVGFIAFGFLAFLNEQTDLFLLSLALSGAVLGFLKYNWYPARVFMGDAGSFFLGFSLGFLAIAITQTRSDETNAVYPVAALLILAVPIVDTVTVMLKRLITGKNPFIPDQNHFHHLLLKLGLPSNLAALLIVGMAACFALFAVVGTLLKLKESYMFMVFLSFLVSYFLASIYIVSRLKRE
jgi:UDP-GlcNAc:undecaprenyl-phosphate GlcNAc-1-phosphate transferase